MALINFSSNINNTEDKQIHSEEPVDKNTDTKVKPSVIVNSNDFIKDTKLPGSIRNASSTNITIEIDIPSNDEESPDSNKSTKSNTNIGDGEYSSLDDSISLKEDSTNTINSDYTEDINLDSDITSDQDSEYEESYPPIPYPLHGNVYRIIDNSDNYPLKDIQIDLYTCDNISTPAFITLSDEMGSFNFNDIPLDNYFLKINVPRGYTIANRSNFTFINPSTLFSEKIYNDESLSLNIGLKKCFKICGIAFLDYYNNGIYLKNSEGISDLKVNIYDKNDILIDSTITTKFFTLDGYYEFNDLPPNLYHISFEVPDNLKVSKPILDDHFGSKANQESNSIIVRLEDSNITDAFIGLTAFY